MFYKDSQNVYRAYPLERFPWLVHGFGTRHSAMPASRLTTLRQTHSAVCVFAEGSTGCIGEGDALLDNTPGSLLAVKTADCLPIFLIDEKTRAVAAVHAGWRGSAAGIVRNACRALQDRFGSRSEHLHAAIGPGIGRCCFEVGPEVGERFRELLPPGSELSRIDLAEVNRTQLLACGVLSERVYTALLCTACGEDEFFSYRRDKEKAGRMFSVVGTV